MTPRRIAWVWFFAFGFAMMALVCLGLWSAMRPALAIPANTPIVAIGTSLFRYAIPPHPVGSQDTLFGDGKAHLRLAENRMREETALECLQAAIEAHAAVVLLELNLFAIDFAGWPQRSLSAESTLERPAVAVLRETRHLANGLRQIKDPAFAKLASEADFGRTMPIGLSDFRFSYPLILRNPNELEALTALLQRAEREHVEVVLVAPPRAEAAAHYMGEAANDGLQQHLTRLAAELGAPLFMPGPDWPDALFIDNAHLNRDGRERFLREIRTWWTDRH